MTKIARYRNWYSMVETYNNVTFVVKFLIVEKIFKKTLGCDSKDNSKSNNINLFWKKTAALAENIPLQNYICQIQKNWT